MGKCNYMDTNDSFAADSNQSNTTGQSKQPTKIQKDKADEKLTLDKEAELSVLEIEQMEKKYSEEAYRGSSGPEEKDITV